MGEVVSKVPAPFKVSRCEAGWPQSVGTLQHPIRPFFPQMFVSKHPGEQVGHNARRVEELRIS